MAGITRLAELSVLAAQSTRESIPHQRQRPQQQRSVVSLEKKKRERERERLRCVIQSFFTILMIMSVDYF